MSKISKLEQHSEWQGNTLIYPPERISINKASTFRGFCPYHDSDLFLPIETGDFEITSQNMFLLSYRTYAYEVYQKEVALAACNEQRHVIDNGRTYEDQAVIQQHMAAMDFGQRLGLRDLGLVGRHYKDHFNRAASRAQFIHSTYLIEGKIPFVCSGGFQPEFDFDGNTLVRLDRLNSNPIILTVNAFPINDSKSILSFGYFGSIEGYCEKFVNTFQAIPESRKFDALARLMFEYIENTFIQPSFWELLNSTAKNALLRRVSLATSNTERRRKSLLEDNVLIKEYAFTAC